MRKLVLAALAALATIGVSAPAQASNGVFITYGDGYRGDYYGGYRGGHYYYDDGDYRPRYRSYHGYKGGYRYRYRYRNYDRFDRRDFRYRYRD